MCMDQPIFDRESLSEAPTYFIPVSDEENESR